VRTVTELLAARLADVTVNHGSAAEAALVDRAATFALADEPEAARSFAHRNALRRALSGRTDRDDQQELAAAVMAHEHDLRALGFDGRSVPTLLASPRADRTNRRVVAARAALGWWGAVANAPVLLGAWGAGRRARGEAWQATAKGVAGTFLCPVTWTAEYVLLARRLGRGPALALTAAGALGGWEFLASRARVEQRRVARQVARAETEQPAAFAAAQASRVAVRKRVEAILGTPIGAVGNP
jgi:hypothetical protein